MDVPSVGLGAVDRHGSNTSRSLFQGKSTLLNSLFHTHFKEMDAFKGRNQITQGIWISKAVGIDPCTLVMDLEGTDGRERGEDDTVFEKQSALFALAVSDIVLINMWCHDIGRQHAANKPLLKTVFQVMMRLFSPRKTTLLFVIRDMSKTPLEFLEPILREDIQKIWDNVLKPPQHQETPLSEFFNVEVMALSSYEEKEEQFRIQVDLLRQRFFNSISPGGLAGNRREVVPASGFPFSTQQIWEIIRENKDLDLPAHKVMVATVRCEAIANEKFVQLTSDGHWHELEKAVWSGPVPGFGKKLSSILKGYISDYELEAAHFDENVRTAKQHQLEFKLLDLVYPSYQAMLEHLHSEALNKFKNELQLAVKNGEAFAAAVCHCTKSSMDEFDLGCADATIQQATWDTLEHQSKLRCDIDAYVASVRFARLSEIKTQFENHLNEELGEPVASLLATASADTWPTIRKILICETKSAISEFSFAIAGFEIDEDTVGKMVESLKDYGRNLIYKKAREEASHVLLHMKDRFSTVFSHGVKSMPRVWTGKEDVRALTKDARLVSLKLLAVMAALRLDEKPDKIESTLSYALTDGVDVVGVIRGRRISSAVNLLASSTWEGVSPSDTLITPVKCRSLWRQFMSETEYIVSQALAAQSFSIFFGFWSSRSPIQIKNNKQEASRHSDSWSPPPWVIAALILLGFNEFMILLRNPLYLVVLLVLFLLLKVLCMQLDIPGHFRHGILSGVLSLSTKFLPVAMNLVKRFAGVEPKFGSSAESNNIVFSSLSSGNGRITRVPTQDAAPVSSSHESFRIDTFEQSSSTSHRPGQGQQSSG